MGRKPRPYPRVRVTLRFEPEDLATLDAMPGKSRDEKIRHWIRSFQSESK